MRVAPIYLIPVLLLATTVPALANDSNAGQDGVVQESRDIREGRESDAHRQELQGDQGGASASQGDVHSGAGTATEPGRQNDPHQSGADASSHPQTGGTTEVPGRKGEQH